MRPIGASSTSSSASSRDKLGAIALAEESREVLMHMTQSRRRFLTAVSSAGAAGLLGLSQSFAQEAPPETTTVRFPISNNICFAPLYVADALLRAEGFTDIRYVSTASGATGARWVARGDADFDNAFVGTQMSLIDA